MQQEDQPKETIEKYECRMQNNVLSLTPPHKCKTHTQLCLHIDNYHTKSFVFKSNLTSFTTHHHITNSGHISWLHVTYASNTLYL